MKREIDTLMDYYEMFYMIKKINIMMEPMIFIKM